MLPDSRDLLTAATAGLLLDTTGTVLNRTANPITRDLTVNAINYAATPMDLLWLHLGHGINVPRPGLLDMGAAAIAAANLLLHRNSIRIQNSRHDSKETMDQDNSTRRKRRTPTWRQ